MIPKGWKSTHLGKVLPKPYTNGIYKHAERYGSGVRILRISDFDNDGNLTSSDLQKVQLDENEIKLYHLRHKDIVINRVNSLTHIGKAILWDDPATTVVYESNMMRIGPDENVITPEFLIRIIQSRPSRTFFKKIAKRAIAQSSINQQDVKALPVLLPPLPEQKAITEVLSVWDRAISNTDRLIQAKEKRFAWLMNSLINPNENSGWQKVKLGDVLTESRLPDKENDPKKRLSVRLHLKGVETREYRGTEADGATTFFRRKAGQFIYGKQNIFRGALGIVPSELDGYSSTQDIPAFDISDSISSEWLCHYFSRPDFYKSLELLASGSGSKRLHSKELLKLKIPLPTLPEQKRIAETLNLAQREIELLKKLAEKQKLQKRGLMQKLLTGEWRVKVKEQA